MNKEDGCPISWLARFDVSLCEEFFKLNFKFLQLSWFIRYGVLVRGVATIALGSRPRQGGCKVAGQVGDPGALHMLPGVQRMWGNEPSHSQVNSHVESWSPERIPESLERDYRGQISSPWRVLYIIAKVLRFINFWTLKNNKILI
jgi:hypothetical protein